MANLIFIFLSLCLFSISIYLYTKTRTSKINKAIFSVLVFTVIIFYLFYFISNYFTGKGINMSVIYHLKYGLVGAGFLEYWELIATSIILITLGLVFSCWIFLKQTKNKNNKIVYIHAAFLLIFLSLFFSPTTVDLYNFHSKESGNTDFYKYYKQPHIRQVDNSKNLVFIYTEGLEQTYFNETTFPGLIKELHTLQSKSIYFTSIMQVTGTGWTIGGMVASQCGIPLFTPSHGNSMSGMDEFLPQAVCLSDLLHKEGYYFVYYGGANLDFAGKRKFLLTHKFDEINGRDELLPKLEDESYKSFWGLYDDSLFNLSYNRFIELSETQNKFALFLLTLDTHHPKGHPSKSCKSITYKNGSNPMLNAVACSDYLISEFVNKIMQSPYGEKTVVVVVSDHLALENTASEILDKEKRRNLFMIIQPGANESVEVKKLGSALDIGPTLLPFIGYKGEIGLGRDLINKEQSESEIENIHRNLSYWEPTLSYFWNFPKIQKYIEINITDRTMNIDDRTFKIPVLMEFNSELETVLRFYWGSYPEYLIDYVLELDSNTHFLLIDECRKVKKLNETLGQSGLCLVIGKGDKYYKSMKLEKSIKLNTDYIHNISSFAPF